MQWKGKPTDSENVPSDHPVNWKAPQDFLPHNQWRPLTSAWEMRPPSWGHTDIHTKLLASIC